MIFQYLFQKKKILKLGPELLKKILPLMSFLGHLVIFIPVEPILVFYIVKYKIKKYFRIILEMTILAVLSAIIVYFFGHLALYFLPDMTNAQYYEKLKIITKQSFLIQIIFITFCATTSIIPFFPLALFSSVLNISFFTIFLPAIFIGRLLRFFIIAFISKKYGSRVLKIFFKKKKMI